MQAKPMISMMPIKNFSSVPPNKEGWSPVANDEGEAAAIKDTKEFLQDAKAGEVDNLIHEISDYS